MKKRILAVGVATKDCIITPTQKYSQIGGAVFYQTITLRQLKTCAESIISIGRDDLELLKDVISKANIIVTENSMEYTNIYDKNFNRSQKAKLPNNPILPEDIKINLDNVTSVLLSPLSPYDIPPETIAYFKKQKIRTILLPQGYLRQTDKNSNIIKRKWADIDKYLQYTDIICLDENEAKTAFEIESVEYNLINKILRKYDLEQIIITKAERGSTIFTKNKVYEIPAIKTRNAVDATGLGDTYIAAYISKLEESEDIYLSGLFASITTKEKLEQTGPLRSNIEKIEKELDKYR